MYCRSLSWIGVPPLRGSSVIFSAMLTFALRTVTRSPRPDELFWRTWLSIWMVCWPRSTIALGTSLAAVVRLPVIITISPGWQPSRAISFGSIRATPRPTWNPSITTSCRLSTITSSWLGWLPLVVAWFVLLPVFSGGSLPVVLAVGLLPLILRGSSIKFLSPCLIVISYEIAYHTL